MDFKGDAFKSFGFGCYEEVVRRAQARLRILHAVYGLLRPLINTPGAARNGPTLVPNGG